MKRDGYCLGCFSLMTLENSAVQTCPSCEFKNVKGDRGRYWNRSPGITRVEGFLKLGIVLAAVALFVVSLVSPRVGWGYGPAGYYVSLLLLAPALVLIKTTSKLTRHMHAFNASMFWTVALILSAAAFTMNDMAVTDDDLPHLAVIAVAIVLIFGIRRCFIGWKTGLLRKATDG